MRMNGSTCGNTHLDDDSGAIVLRRLHPRIASYNDLVVFLMKCNMDLKFIGSGEAAKALLYYVTDYITKPSLPMYVGLSALSYAIQRSNEKFPSTSVPILSNRARGALTIAVNRMISRQEISHQQVMSYLVGGGDVYTSHTFRVLHWGTFDRWFKRTLDHQGGVHDNQVASQQEEDTFVLTLDKSGSISATNQQQDYIYRSTDPVFQNMSLYEFVGMTDKEKFERGDVDGPEDDSGPRRGRKPEPRGMFSSEAHTQYTTHRLRRRTIWTVPVILGDRVPRADREAAEKEKWSRMMLILFVPWRQPNDLKGPGETWTSAFERQKDHLNEIHLRIISNMNVLSECRDARDAFRDMRRAELLAQIRDGLPTSGAQRCAGDDDREPGQEFQLFDSSHNADVYECVNEKDTTSHALDGNIGTRARELLDLCYSTEKHTHMRPRENQDEAMLMSHKAVMHGLKRERRPVVESESSAERPRKKRRLVAVEERVTWETLPEAGAATQGVSGGDKELDPLEHIIRQVNEEMQLTSNPEQERAFRIVATHVYKGGDQLLMYVAGVGGTGKTHVVKAILRFFELLER
ncbi:hypothetical protein C8Q73DRAFT_610188, partial [Cubamyces lactineus]